MLAQALVPERRTPQEASVIVRCESCETRFKLDESRIPARGARVRCSRCKHAFFVAPPASKREERVHQIAEEVLRERTRPPEPSWDLEEGAASASSPARASHGPTLDGTSEDGEDNDWRFEDEVPGLDPNDSGLDIVPPATGGPTLGGDPNEDSLAGLGDPESWDLSSPPPPPSPQPSARTQEPPKEPAPSLVASPAPARAPETPRVRAAVQRAAPQVAVARPPVVELAPSGPRDWLGWAAVVVLVAGVAFASLRPPRVGAVSFPAVDGFEVRDARARLVENVRAGSILVVSGRLENPGSAARPLTGPLEVRLLDAGGSPLPETAGLAPPLPTQRLREEDPKALRAEQDARAAALARSAVPGGGELAFDAVFTSAPPEAVRFVVEPTLRPAAR
jgi:predicted Zn finger-like uncharacterized protein